MLRQMRSTRIKLNLCFLHKADVIIHLTGKGLCGAPGRSSSDLFVMPKFAIFSLLLDDLQIKHQSGR